MTRKPAPPRRRAATPKLPAETEASVLRSIVATCSLRGVYSLRLNSGAQAIPAADGHARRYVRFGEKGCADLLLLLPGGRTAFVEIKRPGKRPDEHQLRWLLARQQAGAVAVWVDRVANFDEILRHLLAGGGVTLDDDGNIGLDIDIL
jgi:hypothetical protein